MWGGEAMVQEGAETIGSQDGSSIPCRHLTTHSTGRGDSLSFMVLPAMQIVWIRAAPVNSSVRLLR
jgi:hypothetical protein